MTRLTAAEEGAVAKEVAPAVEVAVNVTALVVATAAIPRIPAAAALAPAYSGDPPRSIAAAVKPLAAFLS